MSTSKVSHEGEACDAVIRRIETRAGAKRQNMRFPEKENHSAPIELVCSIGSVDYAFEHTIVEPFAGHINLNIHAPNQLKPIKDALSDFFPKTEDFVLHIPLKALENLKGGPLKAVQQGIITWIKRTATTLPIADVDRYIVPFSPVSIPDVPFTVHLHRSKPLNQEGVFSIIHVSGDTIETMRLDRLREAYNKKLPKLWTWHNDCGARTVLILENNDVQLTNLQLVADALVNIEQNRSDLPNEIYLVMTCTGRTWFVSAIRIDNKNYYELCASGESLTTVNSEFLVDLTYCPPKKA